MQATDLRSGSAKSRGGRPLSGKRELHGYDGPMQYLSNKNNPDDMTTVQVMIACNHFFSGYRIKSQYRESNRSAGTRERRYLFHFRRRECFGTFVPLRLTMREFTSKKKRNRNENFSIAERIRVSVVEKAQVIL